MARPDADRFQRFPSPLAMPGQMREPARAVDMHPVELASQTHARLIGMLQRIDHQHLHMPFQDVKDGFSSTGYFYAPSPLSITTSLPI